MARFLSTAGVSYQLEEIIKTADERLILISPYLKINDRIKALLDDRDRFKIDVRVVYGKNQLQPDESKWLESKASIRTSFCKNLHAKCFLNEKFALLTSMNLYEFSQVNNYEMGILVSRDDEHALYDDILQEALTLIRGSEEVRVSVEIVAPEQPPAADASTDTSLVGACIRCKKTIPASPARPYCKSCFSSWRKYENENYEEKYCHLCAKEHKATLAKPCCYECFKKRKGDVRSGVG